MLGPEMVEICVPGPLDPFPFPGDSMLEIQRRWTAMAQGGAAPFMKRIAVLLFSLMKGHQLTDDAKECLGHLNRAGVSYSSR
jgi:hypothetical protein